MSVQRIEYKTKLRRWTTEGIKRPSEQKHSVSPLWPFTFGQINTDFVFTVFELWPPQSSLFILTSVCANCERIPRSCLYSCYLHRKEDGWTGRKDGRFSKRPRTLEDITVITANSHGQGDTETRGFGSKKDHHFYGVLLRCSTVPLTSGSVFPKGVERDRHSSLMGTKRLL